jgi:hypothetical protein
MSIAQRGLKLPVMMPIYQKLAGNLPKTSMAGFRRFPDNLSLTEHVFFLAGLGLKSNVFRMLLCSNSPQVSSNWISKIDKKCKELIVLIYILLVRGETAAPNCSVEWLMLLSRLFVSILFLIFKFTCN